MFGFKKRPVPVCTQESLGPALRELTIAIRALVPELQLLRKAMTDNTSSLADLTAAVANEEAVEQKLVTYVQGVAGLLSGIAANAPADVSAQIEAIVTQLNGDAANMTAAIAAAPAEPGAAVTAAASAVATPPSTDGGAAASATS